MVAFQKIYLFLKDEINVYNQDKKNSLNDAETMGYKQHRICSNPTTFTDIAIELTNNCLNEQKRLEDIDAIITVSQVPDHFLPALCKSNYSWQIRFF